MIAERSSASLSAAASSDPDGTISTYNWMLANPDGIDVSLASTSGVSTEIAVGEIAEPVELRITLTVTDNDGASGTSEFLVDIDEIDEALLPAMPSVQDSLATIEGVDVDSDGVRDDVEHSILGLYPLDTPKRQILLVGAQALQMQVMAGGNSDQSASDAASERSAEFAACAIEGEVETLQQDLASLKLFTLNTEARRQAYLANEALRSGTVQRAIDPDMAECDLEF